MASLLPLYPPIGIADRDIVDEDPLNNRGVLAIANFRHGGHAAHGPYRRTVMSGRHKSCEPEPSNEFARV